jgi:parallel beta-helix repeat protein
MADPSSTELRPAYFVSAAGNDSAAGTQAAPFATLGAAIQAARTDADIDTIYVRGGNYATAQVNLGASDSGLKIHGYPAEDPILAGPGQRSIFHIVDAKEITITGLGFTGTADNGWAIEAVRSSGIKIGGNSFDQVGTAVKLYQSDNNLIAGNTMTHLDRNGVEISDSSDGNKVYANTIRDIGETLPEFSGGVIGVGSSNNMVAFNDIANAAQYGVSFKDFNASASQHDNAVLYNRITNTATNADDTGAIEMLGRSNIDHNGRIEGNYIDDIKGGPGGGTTWNGIFLSGNGIFLDDMVNGTTVKGNFIKGASWDGFLVHGGDNNRFENNFIIASNLKESAGAVSSNGNLHDTAENNMIEKNIVSVEGGALTNTWDLTSPGTLTIDYNLLHNAAREPGLDVHSILADPLFRNPAAGDYSLQSESPAFDVGIQDLEWSEMGAKGYDATSAAKYGLTNFWEFA